MKILAIETSCDDTGIAVLSARGGPASGGEANFAVLSNIVASQIEMGKKYGGVFPAMAKREHLKNLPIVLKRALKEAKISNPEKEINLIAVTNGPGLEPCLWTGVNFAKDLAKRWKLPVVPINHIESHILINYLENKDINFPALALVVSGGHTQLILVKKIGSYKILGETRDDAAGECFDKCARILGLGYPGGPVIAELAQKVRPSKALEGPTFQRLPRPMINTKDYDFSFSGLKTAVLYAWQKEKIKNNRIKILYAAEIQQAIIDVLIKKTIKAARDYKVKTIILGGGVSANQELKRQFQRAVESIGSHGAYEPLKLLFPPANFSTDNGLMTAICAYFHRNKKVAPAKAATIRADANLRIG